MIRADETLLEGLLEAPDSESPTTSNTISPVRSNSHAHLSSDRQLPDPENNSLLEYFRSAREEVLLRVKYRDNWLSMQLLAQIVLFALAQGVEVVGVRAAQPNSSFLFLSIPISLLLASLYHVEDSLIGYLGNYVCAIPTAEAKILSRRRIIRNWDASEQFQLYRSRTLPVRFVAQATAFLFMPLGLFALRVSSVQTWGAFQVVEVGADILFIFIICIILFRGFMLRRKINGMVAPSIVKSLNDD